MYTVKKMSVFGQKLVIIVVAGEYLRYGGCGGEIYSAYTR